MITGIFKGVFKLPDDAADELLNLGIAEIWHLDIINHAQKPLNLNDEWIESKTFRLDVTNGIAATCPIKILSNRDTYENEDGNRIAIFYDASLDENPTNQNKSEILTAVNQASLKFWNNADKNAPDTQGKRI